MVTTIGNCPWSSLTQIFYNVQITDTGNYFVFINNMIMNNEKGNRKQSLKISKR